MEPPEVRYATSGSVRIAYQVWGTGQVDLLLVPGWISHIGVMWDNPALATIFRELGTFCRVTLFDKRGVGLSDRASTAAPLDDLMDDLGAVLDAVGSRQAVIAGLYEGTPISILFAATHPERSLGLILVGGMLKGLRSDEYPWAYSREEYDLLNNKISSDWGTPSFVSWLTESFAPSRRDDPEWKRVWGRELSYGASPTAAIALNELNKEIDVRAIMSSVHVPTLVLHVSEARRNHREHGKYISSHIPGSTLVNVPGDDFLFFVNPAATDVVLGAVHTFVQSLPPSSATDRTLTTILFVDIVRSTLLVSKLGDAAWDRLLLSFLDAARTQLNRFRGREVKTTGDGLLAVDFDGPSRAVRCADALRYCARELGLEVRVGLHTGECLARGGDVEGIAVHIAARVSARARPGEVLVTSTVKDLSVGAGIQFSDRGSQVLSGVGERWHLFAVDEVS